MEETKETHNVHGWGKLMLPVGSYLVWEGGLYVDLHGVIAGASVRGWARQCVPLCMPPMIDGLIYIIEVILPFL